MGEHADKIRSLYGQARYTETVDYIRAIIRDENARLGDEWRAVIYAATNLGDRSAARIASLRWRKEAPEDFGALVVGVEACIAVGDTNYGMNFAEILVRKFPERAAAWMTTGAARASAGDIERAIYELKRALSLDPSQIRAWAHLARLKTFETGDPDIDYIAALPGQAEAISADARIAADFACGDMFDQLGETARAFGHYKAGAAAKRAASSHKMSNQVGLMRNAAHAFDEKLIARFKGAGSMSGEPIILIGSPRSGMALVEQILASHPRIYGAGDTGGLRIASWPLIDFKKPIVDAFAANGGGEQWKALGDLYNQYMSELASERLYIANRDESAIAFAGFVRLALPNARLVFCERDPMDAAWSAFKTDLGTAHRWSKEFGEIAEWMGVYRQTKNAWEARLGGSMIEVVYEDLVADPERQIKRLLKFVGVVPDEACERFYETERVAPLASVRELRKPLHTGRIGAWRRYERELAPLLEAMARNGALGAKKTLH